MNSRVLSISREELEAARLTLEKAQRVWVNHGAVHTTPDSVAASRRAVEVLSIESRQIQHKLAVETDERQQLERGVVGLAWMERMLTRWKRPSVTWLLFSPAVLACGFLGFAFGAGVNPILPLFGCLLVLGIGGCGIGLWFFSNEYGYTDRLIAKAGAGREGIQRRLRQTLAQVNATREAACRIRVRLKKARKNLDQLSACRGLQQAVETAEGHYRDLLEIVQSSRFRLFHTNWRDLRGIPFEQFLEEVFETLGYSVATTQTTNDLGIDLVLHGHGKRIGVQAKGYGNKVGIAAIQEAFTGKEVYRCDCCAVVTNAAFTRAAKAVGGGVGCTLLSGDDIPRLIMGHNPF